MSEAQIAGTKESAAETAFRSPDYWEDRHQTGYEKGWVGYDAERNKASALNRIIQQENIYSVLDFGCGNGSFSRFIEVSKYTGLDVSTSAVQQCRDILAKSRAGRYTDVQVMDPLMGPPSDLIADACISLDVLYHLVEEPYYRRHISWLFGHARRLVIIFSSCEDYAPGGVEHIRHRYFLHDVPPNWQRVAVITHARTKCTVKEPVAGKSFSDFHVFRKIGV